MNVSIPTPGQDGSPSPAPDVHKPVTAAGVSGLVVGGIALLLSWVPIVNNIAFVLAVFSTVLGIVAMVATRDTGRRSARWTATGTLVVTLVAVALTLTTQAFYARVLDEVADGVSGASVTGTAGSADDTGRPADEDVAGTAEFGSTVTFDDGSTLTCSAPKKFTRDEWAVGGDDMKYAVKSKCTFTNGAEETFDPVGTSGSLTAGGVEGDSVYQSGLDAPENPVLPGRSVSWWMGYGTDSLDDMQLTVSLGFIDYDAVTFV